MLKTRNEPTEEEKNLEICTEELTSAKLLPSRADRRTGNRAQVDHRPYYVLAPANKASNHTANFPFSTQSRSSNRRINDLPVR